MWQRYDVKMKEANFQEITSENLKGNAVNELTLGRMLARKHHCNRENSRER